MALNKDICGNELDWAAFCYAAGELSGAEAERFELRLAGDQQAREALARAVELVQVIAAAESQTPELVRPAIATRSNWNLRLSWMAIGGLASVVVAVVWSGIVGPTWHTAQQSRTSARKLQLASAWYETRSELAQVKDAGLWPAVGPASVEADDDLPSNVGVDDYGNDEAPSWLNVAVVLAHDRAAGDTAKSATHQSLEN